MFRQVCRRPPRRRSTTTTTFFSSNTTSTASSLKRLSHPSTQHILWNGMGYPVDGSSGMTTDHQWRRSFSSQSKSAGATSSGGLRFLQPPLLQFQLLRPYHNVLPNHNLNNHNRIRIITCVRYHSSSKSNKNGNDNDKSGIQPKEKEGMEGPIETEVSSSPKQHSSTTETSSTTAGADEGNRIQHIVESVETNFRRVSNEWNTGDLISVYSIVALIGMIVVAPIFVRNMRRTDNTYEDLDPEDPVADLAKIVRDQYLEHPEDSIAASSSGLDAILSDLLKSPQFQDAVTSLVTHVLQSQEFKRACQVLLKELWNDLINDPETAAQVIHLLQHAIQDEQIKKAATELVMEIVNDREVLDELVVLLQNLGNEQKVQTATKDLLVESAHNALNDPDILDHSMEFATEVVGDDVVQRTAGEALYNTLSYAVRPALSVTLSIMGVGLIFLSISALRNASSPEQEIDRAVSATLAALESGTTPAMSALSKILSWPSNVLAGWWEVLMKIMWTPVDILSSSISSASQACDMAVSSVYQLMNWLLSLPGNLAHAIMAMLGSRAQEAVGQISKSSRSLLDHASASFVGVLLHRVASSITSTGTAIRMGCSYLSDMASRLVFDAIQFTNAAVSFGSASIDRTLAAIASADRAIIRYYAILDRHGKSLSKKVSSGVVSAQAYGERSFEVLASLYEHLSKLIARSKL